MVSKNLQESINKSDILSALSTDYSSIFFSLSKNRGMSIGKSLWKFNSRNPILLLNWKSVQNISVIGCQQNK